MNIIFTDIDGVLNLEPVDKYQWNRTSIDLYNALCKEFKLHPVITSTWRVNHTISSLQKIFTKQGIITPIYDVTPILYDEGRGAEIEHWLFNNTHNKFVVIDDHVRDLITFGIPNVIKCDGRFGFTQEEYDKARKILLK